MFRPKQVKLIAGWFWNHELTQKWVLPKGVPEVDQE
jgi:hypothetical protein